MKPLHRVRFRWPGSPIEMEIESVEGCSGEVLSLPIDYVAECTEELATLNGSLPAIGYNDLENQTFYPLVLLENKRYYCSITLPGTLEEVVVSKSADDTRLAWPFLNYRLNNCFTVHPPKYWRVDSNDGEARTTVIGTLSFPNRIGIADLSLGSREQLLVEVASPKLTYFDDFQFLLDEIAVEMVELMLQASESLTMHFGADDNRGADPHVMLFLLRHLFSNHRLEGAIDSILHRPHSRLSSEVERQPLARVWRPDLEATIKNYYSLSFEVGGALAPLFQGVTPQELYESRKYESFDTQENRFVKNFLDEALFLCHTLKASIEEKSVGAERGEMLVWKSSLAEVQAWMLKLSEWLSHDVWDDVGQLIYMPTNSQVLQRREGYREIFQADYQLRTGLKLPWTINSLDDPVEGGLRPIYQLYEYWCYFKLQHVLKHLLKVPDRGITSNFVTEANNLDIQLKQGTESVVTFNAEVEGENLRIDLYYNRQFDPGRADGSYSIPFHPDFTLVFRFEDEDSLRALVHFDAKYRLARLTRDDETIESASSKKEDLVKMHAYKDAIPNTWGSYVLYPGTEKKVYQTIEQEHMGIGAFPLRPQSLQGDMEGIEGFIRELISTFVQFKKTSREM